MSWWNMASRSSAVSVSQTVQLPYLQNSVEELVDDELVDEFKDVDCFYGLAHGRNTPGWIVVADILVNRRYFSVSA